MIARHFALRLTLIAHNAYFLLFYDLENNVKATTILSVLENCMDEFLLLIATTLSLSKAIHPYINNK